MNINDELKYGTNRTRHMIANDPCPQCEAEFSGSMKACPSSGEACECCDGCQASCKAIPDDFIGQVAHYRQLPTSELVRDVTNSVEFVLRERLLDAEMRLKYQNK